jgi:hypothetical protein
MIKSMNKQLLPNETTAEDNYWLGLWHVSVPMEEDTTMVKEQ